MALGGVARSEDNSTFSLSPVVVSGERVMDAQGSKLFDREAIESRPGLQRDTNEILRTSPGVQFSDESASGDLGGEIQPARVSISGGRTYDNAFMVDGMSASTLLDPDSDAKPNNPTSLPGHPQVFFLSPELLEKVELYSFNIPARLGGFTGGVVDSAVRFPDPNAWGALKIWTTRSQWSSLHSEADDFDSSSSSSMQPRFDRKNIDAIVNMPVNNSTALISSLSLRQSDIPLDLDDGPDEEHRKTLNYLLKVGTRLSDGGNAFVSALASPYSGKHYVSNQKDSKIDLEMTPLQLQLGREWDFDCGMLTAMLGFQDYESSRDAQPEFKQWLNTPSKDWGESDEKYSLEGGYGDLRMSQQSKTAKLDFLSDSVDLLGMSHIFGLGLSWTQISGTYDRPETAYVYYQPVKSTKVFDPTGEYSDSVFKEQYFSRRSVYDADSASADMRTYSLYAEDEFVLSRLTLRPGVRISNDDFMENLDISKRLAAQFDVFGDSGTMLIGGLNRYYGQALMTYKLREGRREPRRESRKIDSKGRVYPEIGDTAGYWIVDGSSTSNYRFSSLDTPYVDEQVVGLNQKLVFDETDFGKLSFRWVKRWYEDEFARERIDFPDGESRYVMNNNGFSKYEGFMTSWEKVWPRHSLELNVTFQNTITSNDNYDDSLDEDDLDEQVWYDGSLMNVTDLPRTDFNRPWLANLIYTAKLPHNFSFTNITRARAGYEAIVAAGKTITIDDEKYSIYEKVQYDPVYIFDWKLTWDKPLKGAQKLSLGIEILNVFDSRIRLADSDESFEMGRQLWAGIEYRF